MPIQVEQFEPQFDRLCAAFAVTKPEKIKTEWFKEFEGCDYFTFCKAVKLLQRGDRFPNWGVVWDTYTPMVPQHMRKSEREGCDNCEKGRVFYVDFILSKPDDPNSRVLSFSLVANCAICSKGLLTHLGDVNRAKLQMQDNGEYFTQRALDALPGELEGLEKDNKQRRHQWKKDRLRSTIDISEYGYSDQSNFL